MHKLFSLFLLLAIISSIFGISPVFAGAPDAITDLDKSKLSSDTEIYLKWTAPANNGQTITGYWIESAVETSFTVFNAYTNVTATTGSTAVTYTVTGLSEGDFLKFRVSAISSDGTGSTSNEFMTGTAHGAEDHSGDIQEFSGEQNFGANSKFASSQNFKGSGNHNFVSNNMEFGADSSFNENISFGNGADFNSGIQNFSGANNFGANTIFANGQTFAVAQTFNGTNTFGDAMHFGDNQNFGGNTNTSGNLRLNGLTTGTTDWYTIIALIDEDGLGVDGHTSINATNIGGAYNAGIIYADFSAVTFGSQRNDVTFTDSNNNGVIDCTANNTCELADLSSPVTFAAGTTISFEQDPFHTFGSNTVFAAGTTFVPGQTFSSTQNFADGAMNFKAGMQFFAGQDFNQLNVDHDFSGKAMKYGTGSDFATAETFGEAGNFASGVQLFHGANAFGKDSKFAEDQTFAVAQTFAGANTFGSGTTFAASQDFSTMGIVTSASTDIATDVLINTQVKQDAAFPDISASSGSFETGLVTITFSDVDIAKQDKIQEVLFTDANDNGIIDDGELGRITDVTTSSDDTMIITQAKTQDFDAGAQTFGANMKFAENQKFSEHVQTFGTGIEFSGNANFTAAQTFAADITFDDGQDLSGLTNSTALSATGMTFGSVESIDFGTNAKTFGASATFAENQNFTSNVNHDLSASDLTFKKGTLFLANATEVFGEHVNFDGVIDFPDDQAYPNGAEFADNQSWDADKDPVFANFTTFGNAVSFAEALDFKDAPNFEGTTTFVGANTFGAGTEFETGVTFTQAQTFSGAVDFGVG
ncbi:fibronectin type III domain-containing protein, partial [Marine Group I thaumarchaeote]|nr:fibronectin type III domain-containing protein [Marine Group I thaumarchaeote]